MNKTIVKAGFVVLVLGVVAVPFALAHGGWGGGEGQCGFRHGRDGGFENKFFYKAHFLMENAQTLGLNEKQIESLSALSYELKKKMITENAQIEVLELEIRRSSHGYALDVVAISRLIDQKYDLEKTQAKESLEAMAKLKKTISEDQHKKMKAMFEQQEREERE